MKKDLIDYACEWWNKLTHTDKKHPQVSNLTVTDVSTAPVMDTEELIQNISSLLQKSNRGKKTRFKTQTLLVYINDSVFYHACLASNCTDALRQHLDEEKGWTFRDIKFLEGKVPEGKAGHYLTGEIAIVLQAADVEVEKPKYKATIAAAPGCGSLIGDEVELDPDAIATLEDKRYNIGAGHTPEIDGVPRRVNQIAVDDDPQSPMAGRNKYVSRTHAYICYDKTNGFMLYVEPRGTREYGKRTEILREGQRIDLDSPLIGRPLQDGDSILLNKQVQLKFRLR